MGMVVDTAQQQPYEPVAALTRYLNHRNKPTTREQKEKLSPEACEGKSGTPLSSSYLNRSRCTWYSILKSHAKTLETLSLDKLIWNPRY